MKIVDLLKTSGYPFCFVQGNHTRLLAFDNGDFEVLARKNPESIGSAYTVRWYLGSSEDTAVEEFVKSEES